MTTTTELTRLHAHEMAARLRSGELSPSELTAAHLDLAERQDHVLGALAPLRVIGEEHREGWAAVSLRW